MRNLKKFLALVLAFMMAMSLMVTVSASNFKDDGDITPAYAEAVNTLTELKVIKGYDNDGVKTFDPKANITRGEVAAILYRIVTGDVKDSNIHLYKGYSEFTDVDANLWYAPYINYCANNGLIQGVGGGKFEPKDNITGYQALVMVLRAMGYNNPAEFSSSDWKLKASGYGSRLEITTNIPSGSLGAPATREMVTEIMFKAIQAPMVKYSPLTLYTTDLLVDASEVNAHYGTGGVPAKLYAEDVPNTLLYQTFQIVGKRVDVVNGRDALGTDNYGRPVVEWVKDRADDTVANGGKYIVNPVAAVEVAATDAAKGDGSDADAAAAVNAGEAYIPRNTWAAKYATGTTKESAAIKIVMTPVKTYYDVVTECQLMKDVNDDEQIDAENNLIEWLNGAKVDARTGYTMDALHTATGDGAPTVGAPGRTTQVYITYTDADGVNSFVFVYVDTLMGIVLDTTNRTYDTAGHVMSPATMTLKVNQTVNDVVYSSTEKDFTEYKAGDLVLLTTWGGANKTDVNKRPGVDEGTGNTTDDEKIQVSVPTVEVDFRWDNDGTADHTWAVDVLDVKPELTTFDVNATVGAVKNKTGLLDASGNRYMANIAYLANENYTGDNGGTDYYENSGTTATTAASGETTVPKSPINYGVPMTNARIGQTVTAVRDPRGYVVGLTTETAKTNIGVIMGMDSVRVASGKYAIEAELMMMDGSTKTIRMLHNDDTNYNASTTYSFYTTAGAADEAISKPSTRANENCNVTANVLVRVEPFTKEGATYYKVTATNDGANKAFTAAGVTGNALGNTTSVATGVANTLVAAATYNPAIPVQDLADNKDYINDNTKFIIAEYDYRYNQGEANEGGYTDLVYKTYTGFKTIPTITGAASEILWQKIGNNVFIYPETDIANVAVADRRFTLRAPATYTVDETYLVLAPLATYADHATYKVLKDGVETTLEVSNNNITTVNNDIETAMAAGQLIYVDSKNAAGYATSVKKLDQTVATFETVDGSRTIAVNQELEFAKDGVLYNSTGATAIAGPAAATRWLTVADNCKVIIVNLIHGTYVEGNLDNIMQYEDYDDNGDGTVADTEGHSFVYELDANGYASTIYIID